MRIPYISLLAAGALALGGCADYGYGYGGGGYYGDAYYGGYGYGSPYFGWYGDYYYPGAGVYVYDSYRRPRVMTTNERAYWSRRSPSLRTGSTTGVRENWSGFNRRRSGNGGR
ncbi:MAG TPA: hypothetical protein VHS33_09035 [Sphingomicrobium sp.]|jgi:hypothetical protein|nr:hypothetical protein [Sphingomicrobium sp.]